MTYVFSADPLNGNTLRVFDNGNRSKI